MTAVTVFEPVRVGGKASHNWKREGKELFTYEKPWN